MDGLKGSKEPRPDFTSIKRMLMPIIQYGIRELQEGATPEHVVTETSLMAYFVGQGMDTREAMRFVERNKQAWLPPEGGQPGQWGAQPNRPMPYDPRQGMAGYGAPGYGAPGYGAPGYGAPGYGAPGYGAPGYGKPGYGKMPMGKSPMTKGGQGKGGLGKGVPLPPMPFPVMPPWTMPTTYMMQYQEFDCCDDQSGSGSSCSDR